MERVGSHIPPAAQSELVNAWLRRIGYRVLAHAHCIALAGDQEYIAHANMMPPVSPSFGDFPKTQTGLDSVKSAGRHPGDT